MKPYLLAPVVLLASLLGACDKPQRVSNDAPTEAPAESNAAPAAPSRQVKPSAKASSTAGSAQVQPVAESETPAPEQPKEITVDSKVFATTRISVTTDDGIFGIAPGTPLRVIAVKDNGFRVSDGKSEFDVEKEQVALSSATAAGAAQSDQAQLLANAAWHKAQLDAVQQQRDASARQAEAAQAERKLRETQARLEALLREEAQLSANITSAQQQEHDAHVARINGRAYTKAFATSHVAAWRSRLAVVRAERVRIESELRVR